MLFKYSSCAAFDLQGELVTASKAIIEKEYQPRVIVTKTGPNPFTKLTDQELEQYRREVELKQKGQDGKNLDWFRNVLASIEPAIAFNMIMKTESAFLGIVFTYLSLKR